MWGYIYCYSTIMNGILAGYSCTSYPQLTILFHLHTTLFVLNIIEYYCFRAQPLFVLNVIGTYHIFYLHSMQNKNDNGCSVVTGNTSLIYSAIVGNDISIEIIVRSFRRLGLDVDHVNVDGMSALLHAASAGFVECASILAIDGRANLRARHPVTGRTAEELARARGCTLAEVQVVLISNFVLYSESSC